MIRRIPAVGQALLWVFLFLDCSRAAPANPQDGTDPAGVEFFEKKIRPVLVEHCGKCHTGVDKKPKGGLLLTSRATLLKGGDSGPALVPGQPEKSRLIEAVGYTNVDLHMPPRARLPDTVIADLTTWVKRGAPWPREESSTQTHKEDFDLAKRKREHWAWQPLRSPQPPEVKNGSWPRSGVDRFLLAKLEEQGLAPAGPADRRTLLRRVYFDLIGLPPRPEEVENFVKDAAPDALDKVVERLLAAPQFGERWARHFLDLVRYAESRGHEFDYTLPNAYQYRDYVIRALNADVPYNQFVTEHVAGDLLPRPRLHPGEGFNESILGTGFWFLGEEVHSPVDIRQDQADRFDNRIDVLSKTFLGLTVSCARCHDHKFDAISTRDYYALFGFLASSNYRLVRFDALEHNRKMAAELEQLREQKRALLQQALADGWRSSVEHLAAYLLAAREGLRAAPETEGKNTPANLSKAYRARLEVIARAHKLDAAHLSRWVIHLLNAARDERDPFHAWARVAADAGTGEPKRLGELLDPLVEKERKQQAEAALALNGAVVVVDYSRDRAGDFLPDEFAFGSRPVRPGDVRFGTDAARPILKFFDCAAAEKDPTWDGLKLAPGAQNESGALERVLRPGQILRTPAFTISSGKVFSLVRGQALVYAAVGQHVMIAGPLHGRLVQSIRTGPSFQWVEHNLSVYKGLPAHLEFTAQDGADFAVAMVVQAPKPPTKIDRPNQALFQLLAGKDASSVEALAVGYQQLFGAAIDKAAGDRIIGSPDAAAEAQLANWLLQHGDLFPPSEAAGKHLADAGAAFLADQARLTAQIRRESRLALAMHDGSGFDEHVFIRGSPRAPGELVHRRFLEALAGAEPIRVARGSGRLELARQMTDPAVTPLLPRVLVNRVWHHLFSRGIVASVDNFGVLGERPTHPELLDFLATQFVKEGWSLKKLIRTLILTSAYQMTSRPDEQADQADPQNLLWHRAGLRRLEGEAIRDAMLSVSGRLDARMYGPSVPVYLTAFQEGRGRPASGPLDGDGRRSLYLAVRRNFLSSFLLAFDTPIPFSTMGRRAVSNVPAQALILMNDPFVRQQAEVWAQRMLRQGGAARERVASMYQSAFSRPPTEAEVTACLAFLERQAQLSDRKPEEPAVWADLAHALFNTKEFIFLN